MLGEFGADHSNNKRITKGDTIFIPILAINRAKAIWGQDADEFRWANNYLPCREPCI
jgi:cytochrome P450